MSIDQLKENLKNHLFLAELVEESYKIVNRETLTISGYEALEGLEVKTLDTQVLVGKKQESNAICIAFPGTQGGVDASIDLLVGLSNFNCRHWLIRWMFPKQEIQVHSGFRMAYCSIKQKILDKIATLGNIEKIKVAGHSLGGAIATLCATDLVSIYPQAEIVLYTFGSPAVGNNDFKLDAEGKLTSITRVVNTDDPVPYLMHDLPNYTQVGSFIEVSQEGTTSESETTDVDTSFEAVASMIRSMLKNETPEEHKMTEYIRRIKKIT